MWCRWRWCERLDRALLSDRVCLGVIVSWDRNRLMGYRWEWVTVGGAGTVGVAGRCGRDNKGGRGRW